MSAVARGDVRSTGQDHRGVAAKQRGRPVGSPSDMHPTLLKASLQTFQKRNHFIRLGTIHTLLGHFCFGSIVAGKGLHCILGIENKGAKVFFIPGPGTSRQRAAVFKTFNRTSLSTEHTKQIRAGFVFTTLVKGVADLTL